MTYSRQVWVDPHRHWTQHEFNSHIEGILQNSFSSSVADRLDFQGLGSEIRQSSTFLKIREANFFKNLLEKLMTYAGSINALSGINFKGDEFTRKYEQHLSLWRTCSSDIDALKRKISDLLSNGRVDKSEIEGYRLKIADIDKELLDIQAQINKGNPNVAENLKQVEIDIMNFRRLKSDYEKKRGER